jgi:hypothetical protein
MGHTRLTHEHLLHGEPTPVLIRRWVTLTFQHILIVSSSYDRYFYDIWATLCLVIGVASLVEHLCILWGATNILIDII